MRPHVGITFNNGLLGGFNPSKDGVSALILSGVAVGGQFALGDVLKFNSLADAESKGINAAYDVTNTCMAWKHIKDFYTDAIPGTDLYVMVVAKTVTMTQMTDKTLTYAKKICETVNGDVTIGITRIPQGGYTPTYANQFDTDITGSFTNAIALRADELTFFRTVRFVMEGRDWQGSASSSLDLRSASTGPLANMCSIIISQDADVITTYTWATKYAAVGLALGRLSAIGVQRNMGRIKDGKLAITNAGFSNGAAYSTINDTNQDLLNDKGYIFMTKVPGGIAGFFWNDSSTACPLTDDYCYMENRRTIDKAYRITLATYLLEIKDDVEVDPITGKLQPSTAKHYQGIITKALNEQMRGEIDAGSARCICDMSQNVNATSKVSLRIAVGKKGVVRTFDVLLGFGVGL